MKPLILKLFSNKAHYQRWLICYRGGIETFKYRLVSMTSETVKEILMNFQNHSDIKCLIDWNSQNKLAFSLDVASVNLIWILRL